MVGYVEGGANEVVRDLEEDEGIESVTTVAECVVEEDPREDLCLVPHFPNASWHPSPQCLREFSLRLISQLIADTMFTYQKNSFEQ